MTKDKNHLINLLKIKTMRNQLKISILLILITVSFEQGYAQANYSFGCVASDPLNTSALGYDSKGIGNNSFAAGYKSIANGLNSSAIGENCFAGSQSYAIGQNARATADNSFAFGRFVETAGYGPGSIVIGCTNTASGILINNISNSLMIGFSSSPILFANQTKVGIATSSPKATFDVNGTSLFYDSVNMASLMTPKGTKGVVVTDEYGLLSFIQDWHEIPGDNLGDHIATQNLVLGEFGLTHNFGTSPGLTLTKTNDIYVAKNMSVNENFTVKGGIYGYTSGYSENWNKLEIFGSTLPDAAKIEVCDGSGDNWRSIKFLTKGTTADYQFSIDDKNKLVIRKEKIIIGTPDYFMNLNVNGIINAREVNITLTDWYNYPDYVFSPEYKLESLSEVERFIQLNNHLPEVPSISEVKEKGMNISELNIILLKKIEEMTLYLIELEKVNAQQSHDIMELKAIVK